MHSHRWWWICVIRRLRIFIKTFVPQRWIEPLTINSKYYLFSRVYSSWLRFWFLRMNIYANVKVEVSLTEWGFSIEYCVVYSEHVVRWRLHIACKGLAWILQKHYANCILITRDYSQLYLRFSVRCLERNSWCVLLCGRLFKITMPRKALILPLKARLIILHVIRSAKGIFCRISPIGKKWKSPQKRLYYSKRLDQNYRMRKSVYIVPQKWTKPQFSLFGASKILQKTTKRLYYSKRLDQNYRMRKSVYIIPKNWTTEKHRKNGVKKYVKIYAERAKASILFHKSGPNYFLGSFFHAR